MRQTFWADRSGSFAFIFALALVPLIGIVGLAVDYSRLSTAHSELQTLCDGASLAVIKRVLEHPDATTQSLEEYRAAWVKAHGYRRNLMSEPTVNSDPSASYIDRENGIARLELTSTVPRSLMRVVNPGATQDVLRTSCGVKIDFGRIDVALALDNSGSMSGVKIAELKKATERFAQILFQASSTTKIGLVPFAGFVNVGPDNKNESWIDRNAIVSYHPENTLPNARRFDLYQALNMPWAGCVEARRDAISSTVDHDVDDAAATNADTLFVPTFAPDEPDLASLPKMKTEIARVFGIPEGYVSYPNNYLSDTGGACVADPVMQSDYTTGMSQNDAINRLEWRQRRTCKYTGGVATQPLSPWVGPNYGCFASPITPLTDNEPAIKAAVQRMAANGGTNVAEGMGWAWRVLSPGAPFTGGVSDEDLRNGRARRIIVLMSDGESNIGAAINHNLSVYSPYGYALKQRLGPLTLNSADHTPRIDARLKETCANFKNSVSGAPGNAVEIYTIGFMLPTDYAKQVMIDCASSAEHAEQVNSASELEEVFEKIARRIGQIRITS